MTVLLCCFGQSMLRYRSDLLRTMGTLLFLPAFLTGATEQKQVLEVELFSDFTDDPVSKVLSSTSACACVSVLEQQTTKYFVSSLPNNFSRHVQYAPSATAVIEILSNKVQIYSSQLYVHAHFTGIR